MPSHFIDPDADSWLFFLRVAAMLESGCSLTSAAHRLNVSASTISLLLDRVQEQFPEHKLLIRRSGAHGGTELTDSGRRLLDKGLSGFRDLSGQSRRFVVACAHTLIELLGPVIGSLVAGEADKMQINLRVETKLRFDELLGGIVDGEIDLAFVYGLEERLRKRSGIRSDELPHRFDLVFISHDEELMGRLKAVWQKAATPRDREAAIRDLLSCPKQRCRVVTLDGKSQPLAELLAPQGPFGDREPIVVDTYDAVLAIVCAKLADIAVIPAVYPTLLRLHELGSVHFSDAIGDLPVAAIYQKSSGIEKTVARLIRGLSKRLLEITRRPSERTNVVDHLLPRMIEEYQPLRYGYYIDGRREGTSGAARPPFLWRWETIDWKLIRRRSISILAGTVTNVEGDTFDVEAEVIEAGFLVRASKKVHVGGERWRSVVCFVSIFTFCAGNPLIVCGTWTTIVGKSPSVFATVFSQKRLSLEELLLIQESAEYRTFLSSRDGVRFDDQPS